MPDRADLMRACEENDFTAIREAGWMRVYEALDTWWARRFDLKDFRPYMDVLGEEKPANVEAALTELRDQEWRPPPTLVYRTVAHKLADADQKQRARAAIHARDARPDQSMASLMRVRMLIDGGEKVCDCSPRPNSLLIEELDGRRWATDDLEAFRKRRREWMATRLGEKPNLPDHVIRCAKCQGIEQGQAFEAQDMLSPEPDFRLP